MDRQNQIQLFIRNLTKSELDLITDCYSNPKFIGFARLKNQINNWDGSDLLAFRKFAFFEKTFKVKLFELLNISGKLYEGHIMKFIDSVTLTVTASNRDIFKVRLGVDEQESLHSRDSMYFGSWDIMKEDIRIRAASIQDEFLPTIINLSNYEKKYGINLGVLLRSQFPLRRKVGRKSNAQ